MGVLSGLLKEYDKAAGEVNVHKIQTGVLPIDYVTDGGIPLGRVIEVYGENGTGKSTFAMAVTAAFLNKTDRAIVYVDSELSFDDQWAAKNGIDTERYINEGRLYILYPNSLDEAFEAVIKAVRSGEVGLVVIDSLTALSPKELIESSPEDIPSFSKVGTSARKQTNFINSIMSTLKKTGTTLLVINQVRANISPYGAATTVPGSYALKHAVSIRLEIKRDEFYGPKEQPVGIVSRLKCHKNKNGVPFRSERLIITILNGLSVLESNAEFMIEYGYIKQSGSIYTIEFNGKVEKVKGKKGVQEFFMSHPDVYENIVKEIVDSGFKVGGSDASTLFNAANQGEG